MHIKLALLALLLSPAAFADDEKPFPHCRKKTDSYHDMIERSHKKAQSCAKDSDCVLLFEGPKLSWCDLGFAISKKAMGSAWLKKLERLRVQAEKACPEPDNQQTCSAAPKTRAVCVRKRCETN